MYSNSIINQPHGCTKSQEYNLFINKYARLQTVLDDNLLFTKTEKNEFNKDKIVITGTVMEGGGWGVGERKR